MGRRAWRRRLVQIRHLTAIFAFPFSIFLVLVLPGGCASPGQPVARKPQVPAPIADLAAERSGNSAVLTFTLPHETVERRLLKHAPAIEIYRDFSKAQTPAVATTAPADASLLVTIPSAVASHYEQKGRIHYVDAWMPEVLKQHLGEIAIYVVRTRVSPKKQSPDSNIAAVAVYPVPEAIADLQAKLASSAVSLSWTAPPQTPAGPAPPIQKYEIYRAELSAGSASEKGAAAQPRIFAMGGAKGAQSPPEKIGTSESPEYEDRGVAVGAAYQYFVRSVVAYAGQPYESADSNLATITMRDVFPPSAPTGLVVVPVPAEQGSAAHLDLSWNINPETDVAGYNVYRSEQESARGTRLNSALLPTPAYSDMSAVAGQRYWYRVTAVDRSGNESAPSAAGVPGEVPAGSQPKP